MQTDAMRRAKLKYRQTTVRSLTIDLPRQMYDDFKAAAERNRKTKTELIREFISDYISENLY